MICERAALDAANESGVPLGVLRAISLTETGRRKNKTFQPWPWTVNMEGVGKWFDTFEDARSYVEQHFQRGARSFDVGCFQINYRWHHQAFESIDQMFDPRENALYAARFLTELYEEFGDWSKAAGAYHSRTPKYANKYKARFDRILANLEPLPQMRPEVVEMQPPVDTIPVKPNTFPLLQRGAGSALASLVPLRDSAPSRMIDLEPAISLMSERP
jgi:hypothetical protein